MLEQEIGVWNELFIDEAVADEELLKPVNQGMTLLLVVATVLL